MRIFIHTAISPNDARQLYDKLLAELSEDYEVIESAPTHALLKHNFLKTYFALMYEDASVFGVEKYPEAEAASAVLKRLQIRLSGEGAATKNREDLNSEDGYYGEGEEENR